MKTAQKNSRTGKRTISQLIKKRGCKNKLLFEGKTQNGTEEKALAVISGMSFAEDCT
jgi:hypothetical protein